MNDFIHRHWVTTAMIFAACLATGCSEKGAPTQMAPMPAATASYTSSQTPVVGTVPAEPTRDTQPNPSAAKCDISEAQQSNSMPMPGQANDHSTTAPNASQKADTKND